MAPLTPSETCVVLRLEFGSCSREELQDWAIVIQEVVDQRAGEAAPGAAVRCTYEPLAVEVLFTAENATPAEVHQRVTTVVQAIETVVPRFDTDTATRTADPRELVAA
ncbi:MAG TPA: hypothetical protein VL979_13795 [Solirubrobacteraceae bacterium]|nr:hypothetical protein [Solirubrobacteraceae bacterium]